MVGQFAFEENGRLLFYKQDRFVKDFLNFQHWGIDWTKKKPRDKQYNYLSSTMTMNLST